MAYRVQVRVNDGQTGLNESLVDYPVANAPSDILFFEKDGIFYASWWNRATPPQVIEVPANQVISVD